MGSIWLLRLDGSNVLGMEVPERFSLIWQNPGCECYERLPTWTLCLIPAEPVHAGVELYSNTSWKQSLSCLS